MHKFPFIAVAAAVTVAACGGYDPVRPASSTSSNAVTTTGAPVNAPAAGPVVVVPSQSTATTTSGVQVGSGRVVSVSKLQGVPTTGNGTGPANRVALVMDNGSAQYVDTFANLTVGERVEIMNDGRIRYSR